MNKLVAKLFYRKKYIKIKVVYNDKKMRTFYEVPIDNLVVLKSEEKAFTIDSETMVLEDGRPTYYYNVNNANAFNLHGVEDDLVIYNPAKTYLGLNTTVLRKLFKLFSQDDNLSIKSLIPVILTFIGLGILYYVLNGTLTDIYNKIDELQRLIELVNGIS